MGKQKRERKSNKTANQFTNRRVVPVGARPAGKGEVRKHWPLQKDVISEKLLRRTHTIPAKWGQQQPP